MVWTVFGRVDVDLASCVADWHVMVLVVIFLVENHLLRMPDRYFAKTYAGLGGSVFVAVFDFQ